MIADTTCNVHIATRILRQLAYSEVFNHPLTTTELANFCGMPSKEMQFHLEQLAEERLINREDDFWFLTPRDNKIDRRKAASEQAQKHLKKAHQVGRLINRFPYVRGVAISGSLSKGVLYNDSDFDFFIITDADRLWIARTILILYKKLFLLNSRKYFCVNYFIDTNHLEIEEQNIFTATELFTLLPISGDVFQTFYSNNDWVQRHFPGYESEKQVDQVQKRWLSKTIMYTLKGTLGEQLDTWCLKQTLRRWKRKFNDFDHPKFELTMKSRRYVSKHHPNDFQTKVLRTFAQILTQYTSENEVKLRELNIEL